MVNGYVQKISSARDKTGLSLYKTSAMLLILLNGVPAHIFMFLKRACSAIYETSMKGGLLLQMYLVWLALYDFMIDSCSVFFYKKSSMNMVHFICNNFFHGHSLRVINFMEALHSANCKLTSNKQGISIGFNILFCYL